MTVQSVITHYMHRNSTLRDFTHYSMLDSPSFPLGDLFLSYSKKRGIKSYNAHISKQTHKNQSDNTCLLFIVFGQNLTHAHV